ncbi:HAD domain-containing protein [Burkholderia gladioli]|uniref:HAD domain-containing protein n=1 Tax=Burkholderia gladioli TaxID=28095 RepID=UPI0022D518EF|nr:HAD domain-containing protein [Burkholderia gladioli]MDA0573241.1 HAD domain-containing protein [Burkholderia gladioli]MDA0601415.1 HAD domain-containing protein [Burkholderia gladioli]
MHGSLSKSSLLLDFDGVLHGADEEVHFGKTDILRNRRLFVWLPILENILKPYPEVEVIVSSSWRLKLDDENLVKVLGSLGSRFAGVVGSRSASRADEIRAEVSRRKLRKWLAIDDHPTVVAASKRNSHFIACQSHLGLGERAVQERLRAALRDFHCK